MKVLNKNVAYRFLNHQGKKLKLYKLDVKTKSLRFKKSDVEIIKNYSSLLVDLINSKWALHLEKYNTLPYLQRKVIDSAETYPKRQN